MSRDTPGVAAIDRRFKQQWHCTVFAPAAWVEERIIGIPVVMHYASQRHPAEQAIGMPPTPGESEGAPALTPP
jgi:hypothetical protein